MDEVQEPQDLLAAYGRMAMDDTASPRDRARQLTTVVTDLLRRTVGRAAVRLPARGSGDPRILFDFEGRDYLITCVLDDGVRMRPDVGIPVEANGGPRWSLLTWSRFPGRAEKRINLVRERGGVVLDRSHVDAAVAGLVELAPLIRDVFRRQECHLTLADLVLPAAPPPVPLVMMPPDRMGTPVGVPTLTWQDVTSEVALVGEATVVRPTGMAWRGGSLLVTCEDGLLELDPVRGRAEWFLPLPGCHGAPLVGQDGAVLVMAGPAVVRWHNGTLTAVAGAFDAPGPQLMAGHDGEPWVLSGSGATLGTGQGGTLALTRVGAKVGDHLRRPLTFDAAVRSAAWLSRRRFFLAAGGHSVVADLERSTDLNRQEDWIPTAGHYPSHLLVTGPDTVLSASTAGSGNRVDLHRTRVDHPSAEHLVEYQLDRVLGLAQPPGDGPAYLLASLPSNDHTLVRPVLTRISGLRHTLPSGESAARAEPEFTDRNAVSLSARGRKSDYQLDRLPFAPESGQGDVFRAVHTASGIVVAFKRRLRPRPRARRRMEREVTIAQKLRGHPHVMPVLDHDLDFEWFVMPMAQGTLAERRSDVQGDEALRELVDAVGAGLAAAHEHGWVHRDIKPANILLLNGRWTVADWGIARRPRGETSAEGRLTNASIGSGGWAAPELTSDPHDGACFASDIYSLGQVIGWILTGDLPHTNTPLLPDPGPWRGVVRRATYRDPAARPQTVADFIALVERETGPTDLPITRAHDFLRKAADGDEDAAELLVDLAVDQAANYELYLDVITQLSMDVSLPALLKNPARAIALVDGMAAQVDGDRGTWPRFTEADRAILWLLRVSRSAAREEEWDLLEAAARGLCIWDGRLDRWDPQRSIKSWLRSLSGHGAQILASVLREYPRSAQHFSELADERHADVAIRNAVQAALQG
ncbi:protein kinase [Streptomyces niveus]|uniref:protein kinase domain-containing protein n=1 Tax=Streptomyces niveus TaxID=193462 RepID=UPI003694E569